MKGFVRYFALTITVIFCATTMSFGDNTENNKQQNTKFMEQSLIILKPDCMKKMIAGQVITRFENAGLKVAACKVMTLNDDLLKEHYAHLTHLPFFPEIMEFMSSEPVMVMILEGNNAVERIRNLLGPTDSQKAPAGTIRGDYGSDKMRNIAHASDSKESAEAEIARFFK